MIIDVNNVAVTCDNPKALKVLISITRKARIKIWSVIKSIMINVKMTFL